MEALKDLSTFVPEWHILLDNLNSKIADRQVELAQLAESEYRPPTRSLRNKGSTESLRPENDDNPFRNAEEPDHKVERKGHSSDPQVLKDGALPGPSNPHPMPPPLLHHSSSPGAALIQKRPSRRLNTPPAGSSPITPPVLRKRKTESIASGGSQPPKYRTRSMIIVYYDSFVQNAFENLVKYISTSRNAMRKGKMAARMASMRQMAEIEVDDDDDEDDNDGGMSNLPSLLEAVRKRPSGPVSPAAALSGPILADNDDDMDMIPKLKFVSTRDMGPKRDSPAAIRANANRADLTPGVIRPQRRGMTLPIAPAGSNIYDELDTGLEWCQSMCEHAAHQFLRDGDCSIEIEGIKKRLAEVRETAEQEMSKTGIIDLAVDPGDEQSDGGRKYDQSREMRSILMRKSIGPPKPLEADEMEVDDEGFDDDFEIPNIMWRSSRDLLT